MAVYAKNMHFTKMIEFIKRNILKPILLLANTLFSLQRISKTNFFWGVQRALFPFLYILNGNLSRTSCSKLAPFRPFLNFPTVQ